MPPPEWAALVIEVLPGKFTTIAFTQQTPANYITYMLWHGIETVLCGCAPHEPYLPGEYSPEEEEEDPTE